MFLSVCCKSNFEMLWTVSSLCFPANQSIEIGEHQGGITVPFGYIYTPRFPYSYYRFGEYSETFLIEEPDSTALQLTAYNMSIWKSTKAGCGEEDHYLKIKSYSQNKVCIIHCRYYVGSAQKSYQCFSVINKII